MKYHSGTATSPSATTLMLTERQRLSPFYLPLGLGLIMMVSGCAWVLGRLVV
jgi:hypothetical protein